MILALPRAEVGKAVKGGDSLTTSPPRMPSALSDPCGSPTSDRFPVGASLLNFWEVWASKGASLHVTNMLRHGYRIPFLYPPVMSVDPIHFPTYTTNSERYTVLKEAVGDMLRKGATEVVTNSRSPGFYSRLFVVPKKNGKWRPIIDLSPLNKSIVKTKFKMETTRTVLSSIRENQWFTSIDLTDAYFHIPIHPSSKPYLRFVFEGLVYQFRALCFGISPAPQVFTEVMKTVGSHAHQRSIRVHQYIDDWLCVADTETGAREDTQWLLETATSLGLRVNMEKSELKPTQRIVFLGVIIDTVKRRAYPSVQRLDNFSHRLRPFLTSSERPMWEWLSLLGHMASLEKLVYHARTRMRAIQFHLKLYWSDPIQKNRKVPVSAACRLDLAWWTDQGRMTAGISLETMKPDFFLYSDASMTGWGATVDHLQTHGLWTPVEAKAHINVLELEAVARGLRDFQNYLESANVCILSDNTTVVSHLNKQGGTRSKTLCQKTVDLILWTEQKNISLMSKFVPGRLNVTADMLSRRHQVLKNEWSMHPDILHRLWKRWDRPLIDLFATSLNHKLPLYFSPIPDQAALGVDAMLQEWPGHLLYAFPPIALIRQVLNKVQRDRSEMILIAPSWPNQEWFPDLLDLLVEVPVELPMWHRLLRQPHMNVFHQQPQVLALHAWKLSCSPSKRKAFRSKLPTLLPEVTGQELLHCTKPNGTCSWIGAVGGKSIHSMPLFAP